MLAPSDSSSYIPDQGDIVWLVLNPRVGHEQSGHRPAIVVSPRLLAETTGMAIICPITTMVKGFPSEVLLKKTKTRGAILPVHLRSVDIVARKAKFIETASTDIVSLVLEQIETLLGR